MKYDVAIYGNLVRDTFCIGDNKICRMGGIANVQRHLNKIAPELNVALVPIFKGHAIFAVHPDQTELLHAEMNDRECKWREVDALWSHLAYANSCGDSIYGHYWDSVDVSPSGGELKHLAASVAFRNTGANPYARGSNICNYIVHSPRGSMTMCGSKWHVSNHKKHDFHFTVGAGDMLAAEVINSILKNPEVPLYKLMRQCHHNVIEELKNEQTMFTTPYSG